MTAFWQFWRTRVPTSSTDYEKEIEHLRQKAPIPAIWLFGKTGSGKSSIIKYLTGAESTAIGEGYRPMTKTSRSFDFPDSDEPLLTFIDTRGLGEAAYDPQTDIEQLTGSTQLMVVVVKVSDHALQCILEPLRSIRKAFPHRPTLLVLTCLHEATGAIDLSEGIDPFVTAFRNPQEAPSPTESLVIPTVLQQLIDEKLSQFKGLYDVAIPIDLTQKTDGFADPDFGGSRLKQSILEYLPRAYRQALLTLNKVGGRESIRQKKSRWQVLSSSALAATAGAVPVPWVDVPVVLAIQAHLALRIAAIYEQEITPSDWALLSSAAGSRIVARMVIMEALKFIPFLGMAAGAASSFAFTYALGMSWDWYFANVRGGTVPSHDKLREIFADQLKRGRLLWSEQ